ncbi:MAG: hypothetical protein A2X64_09595 [Ignavibacteria bacterium GWF2_33_9]|nr:MAG: hypothetical protein A2X64_09595 [Ignavibacteria bacterium GWF2_33_9]
MTKYFSLVLFIILFAACSKTDFETHDHSENGNDDAGQEHEGHGHGSGDLENIKFTVFSDAHELFAEMTPLIINKESEFVVHFTKLSDFKAITKGALRIVLSGDLNSEIYVDSIARAGIFLASYTPKKSGAVNIAFIYENGEFSDTIKVASQQCFASESEAKHHTLPAEDGITFLKEEAWKIDFALTKVTLHHFAESYKATGITELPTSEEIYINSTASGILSINSNSTIPGKKIKAGEQLFKISANSTRDDNFQVKFANAKSDMDKNIKDFDRISKLYESKIVSESEYLNAKTELEKSTAEYNKLSQLIKGGKISVNAPKSGFIKKVLVNEGQFVEAGTPLAILTNNNKLFIRVDIPNDEYLELAFVSNANFEIGNKVYNLQELKAKITGGPVYNASTYVSLYFEIENKFGITPNTILTAYLKGKINTNSLLVPKSSIWEDQGHFYVFLQKNGELFEKREVEISGFDGVNYKIESGIALNDVIVSKGTYKVMLASKNSELPSHSHVH